MLLALGILIAWGALAFGAVYPWAYWPLTIGTLTVGLVGLQEGRRAGIPGPRRGLVIALAVVGLATAVQLLPFSGRSLTLLSPSGDEFFGSASSFGLRTSLSLNPWSTAESIVWLLALAVLFAGCYRAMTLSGVGRFALGMVGLGLLLALVGIVENARFDGAIYGFWEPSSSNRPFGPFINENHFAGWMIMGLPLAIGYFCAGVANAMRDTTWDWRKKVLWFSTPAANELTLVGLAAIVMGVALVLTLSRSGISGFLLAISVSAFVVLRKQTTAARRSVSVGFLLVLLVVGIGWVGVDAVGNEFAMAPWGSLNGRVTAWQDGLRIVRDFAVTGTGMNTYDTATLLYSADLATRFTYAHNDYIQFAAEAGLLVGVPVLVAVFLFAKEVRHRFVAAEDDLTTYWVRTGAVTGLIAIAFQEVIEFSLQMPGNAVLFTVLCAVAIHPAGAAGRHATRTLYGG